MAAWAPGIAVKRHTYAKQAELVCFARKKFDFSGLPHPAVRYFFEHAGQFVADRKLSYQPAKAWLHYFWDVEWLATFRTWALRQ